MVMRTSVQSFIGFALILGFVHSAQRLSEASAQETRSTSRSPGERKPAWLEGTGENLRMKVAGEVVDEDGKPIRDYRLQVQVASNFDRTNLAAATDGSRFEVWVPVGSLNWFGLHFSATSEDGHTIAAETLWNHEVRQAAIDGLRLEMKQAERTMEILVVEGSDAVPDAWVTAKFAGARVSGQTNAKGRFIFPATKRDNLMQLTAWTRNFKIGGFSFNRDPPRDPLGERFTVELENCRDETIRLIRAEDNSPIADLEFRLTVGTGPPNYQFTGHTPDCRMRTNADGEAVFRWFPDWEKHGSYVEILDPRWVKAEREERADGMIVVKLRKSQFEKRRRVEGRVKSIRGNTAGFLVTIKSFQGEEKNRSDHLSAFTDAHGRFSANVLPGATYCICINDARFVSNIIDLIPYDPASNESESPTLEIRLGKPVQVVVTSGPGKRPIAHQGIQLETLHRYSWREDGKTRHGVSGRRWWVTTDERGKAFTFAQPGTEIKGTLYSPQWRSEESVQVNDVGVTRLEFHQRVAAARRIVGHLRLAENVKADLDGATIEIGSLDGETRERLTIEANAEGVFAFESKSTRIGLFARTADAAAAAVAVVDNLDEPLEVELHPTGDIRGQLLGEEDWPLPKHKVRVSLRPAGPRNDEQPVAASFLAAQFESETDSEGNYSFTGLPRQVTLTLSADSLDDSRDRYLQRFRLSPDDRGRWVISRLWKPKVVAPFAERYEEALRDSRLSHLHAMVIVFRPSDSTTPFVDRHLMDYGRTKEVSSFLQLLARADDPASLQMAEFLHSKNWPMPAAGRVFACAVDETGEELGRIEFDCSDSDTSQQAQTFIRTHAPRASDAKEKWEAAFSTAKQTNRNVWVRISQRYCRPCFVMARWLDDQKETLEQDYVFLKIDDVRDLHGNEVAQRLTQGKSRGVPFHAIFDPSERMLIDSLAAIGNVGHPSDFEGRRHLRKMLKSTSNRLTSDQIDAVVASLSD